MSETSRVYLGTVRTEVHTSVGDGCQHESIMLFKDLFNYLFLQKEVRKEKKCAMVYFYVFNYNLLDWLPTGTAHG